MRQPTGICPSMPDGQYTTEYFSLTLFNSLRSVLAIVCVPMPILLEHEFMSTLELLYLAHSAIKLNFWHVMWYTNRQHINTLWMLWNEPLQIICGSRWWSGQG